MVGALARPTRFATRVMRACAFSKEVLICNYKKNKPTRNRVQLEVRSILMNDPVAF
jgi:hypothetical protein